MIEKKELKRIIQTKILDKRGFVSANYTCPRKLENAGKIDILDSLNFHCLKFFPEINYSNLKEKFFIILNDIEIIAGCKFCGDFPTFKNSKKGFNDICSSKSCRAKKAAKPGIKQSKEFIEKRIGPLRGKKRPKHSELLKIMFNTEKYKKIFSDKAIASKTTESRSKQSILMKKKILNGEFTPNIHNRYTKWNTEVDGKKFRSSFEAIFWIKHRLVNKEEIEYEKLRIPYVIDGIEKIYMVDFIDKKNKIVFEIKPSNLRFYSEKEKAKEKALKVWCEMNSFEFVFIDETIVFSYFNEIKNLFNFKILLHFQKIYGKNIESSIKI